VPAPPLTLPEDGLDVVTVWIQNEGREVAKGIVAGAESRATIILAARRNCSAVKVLDLMRNRDMSSFVLARL
jgi:hypothetical protein